VKEFPLLWEFAPHFVDFGPEEACAAT
jgi:hypothetical protein